MKSFKYVITDPVGIHARPAGALVKEIKKYDSDVKVLANGKSADGKKLMNLMSLGVKQGNEIEVQVSGGAEEEPQLGRLYLPSHRAGGRE